MSSHKTFKSPSLRKSIQITKPCSPWRHGERPFPCWWGGCSFIGKILVALGWGPLNNQPHMYTLYNGYLLDISHFPYDSCIILLPSLFNDVPWVAPTVSFPKNYHRCFQAIFSKKKKYARQFGSFPPKDTGIHIFPQNLC